MKTYASPAFIVAFVLASVVAQPAAALSCLSVGDYLKTVVGDENIVIFSGTSKDLIENKDNTAEVIEVDKVLQGYAESKTFVYHQKDETWGYLCNAGPMKKGETGVYIAARNSGGSYDVHQRLETTDPLVKTLEANLAKEEITGEKVEFSKTDRTSQIFSVITDLFKQVNQLLKEFAYWRNH